MSPDRSMRGWWVGALLLGGVLLVYSRALECGFVDFDDDLYVTGNPQVQQGLNAETFAWAWTATVGVQWYPLTLMSHLADASLFGLDPRGHHATSVLLHAMNSLLLFVVLRAYTRQDWPSAIAAALFALHPLRVESVVWISERKDVLSGLFWMMSLWAWQAYVRAGRRAYYVLSLSAFAAGLMSKPMTVTLPGVLLLLDVWPLQRLSFGIGWARSILRLAGEKLPFFLLSVATAIGTLYTQSAGGAVASAGALPLGVRVLNSLGAYGIYVWQSFVPAGLAIPYPVPTGPWLWARAAGGGLVLASWLGVGWWMRRTRPYLLVGGLWFAGVLVPVIGIVQVGWQAHADRYTYIPQIGLIVALVWLWWDLLPASEGARRRAPTVVATACILLGVLTWIQIGYWKSSETLFRRALAVTGRNSRAEVGYGTALLNAGRARESIAHLERAIQLESGLPHPRRNLATAWARLGDFDTALRVAESGLGVVPDDPILLAEAGTAALNIGRYGDAVGRLSRLVELEPGNTRGWVNLGIARGAMEEMVGAQRAFSEALRLDPGNVDAMYNQGIWYVKSGQVAAGREMLEKVLERDQNHALALQALADLPDPASSLP